MLTFGSYAIEKHKTATSAALLRCPTTTATAAVINGPHAPTQARIEFNLLPSSLIRRHLPHRAGAAESRTAAGAAARQTAQRRPREAPALRRRRLVADDNVAVGAAADGGHCRRVAAAAAECAAQCSSIAVDGGRRRRRWDANVTSSVVVLVSDV